MPVSARDLLRGIACLLLIANCSPGQIRSASIVGQVVDSSGAPVPGAAITVTESRTIATFRQTTGEGGEFTVPYLAAGRYSVSVSKEGFRPETLEGFELGSADTARADFQLELGGVENSVTVSAALPELQTESGRVQDSLAGLLLQSLPNINNNPLLYAALQPGVAARAAMSDTQSVLSFGIGSEGRRSYSNFQVNGGAAFSSDVQLDGVSIVGSAWNEIAIVPNTEAIQEVRTLVNALPAEYGRSQGTILITTKSGTNRFHGSVQFRLRNEALNANRLINNTLGVPKTRFRQQSYSETLGGPLKIPRLYNGSNRTFFFVSHEGFVFRQLVDYFRTVPTAAERTGDFSRSLANVNGRFVPALLFDPFDVVAVGPAQYARRPFPGSIIPRNRMDPAMERLANEFPLPNRQPDDPSQANNFFNQMARDYLRNSINSRLDHRASNHTIYLAGGANLGRIGSPNGWGDSTRAYTLQGAFAGASNRDRNYYGTIGDSWTLSPRLFADLRVGFTRVATENLADRFAGLDYRQFGLPARWDVSIGLPGAFPEATGFGGGFSQVSPLNQTAFLGKVERQTNWTVNGSVTRAAGSWNHKWGAEYREYLSNYADPRGSYNLATSNSFTSGNIIDAAGNPITSLAADRAGSGLASYLLGAGSVTAGENAVRVALASRYFAFFQQSDWRVTPRLMINLGLRYDLQPGPRERYNRMSAFSEAASTFGTPGGLVYAGANGRGLYRTAWRDLGPRAGFAFRAMDSVVLRGGFGILYLPSNTGYLASPYYYGNQRFAPVLSDPRSLQYGPAPAGRLLRPYNQVNELLPAIGADASAPQNYGGAANEAMFDYDGFRSGKLLQWNFTLEKKIAHRYLLSASYQGSRSYRLFMGRVPLNSFQLLPQALLENWRAGYAASGGVDPGLQQIANPFQPPQAPALPFNGNLGNPVLPLREALLRYPLFPGSLLARSTGFSSYHSLQLHATRSFSNALQFSVHYTWSKAIELSGSELQNNTFAENGGLQSLFLDRTNFRNSVAISPNDIPHRFVTSVSYALPVGRGRRFTGGGRWLQMVLGNWSMASVLLLQSGQPQQGFTGGSGSLNGLANRIPGVPIEVPKELQRWYDSPSAADRTVSLPGGRVITVCRYCFLKYNVSAFNSNVVHLGSGAYIPDVYWWGTAAQRYGDVRVPGRANMNLSLQKTFFVRDHAELQLSAEATNLWNNSQFRPSLIANLGGVFTGSSAALGIQPGMMQNANFGTYGLSTFDPRQVEIRLRVRF